MYVNKWYVRALYVYGGVIMPVHLYMEVKGGHGGPAVSLSSAPFL